MNIYFCACDTPLTQAQQRELALYLLDHALEREFKVKRGEIIYGEHGKPYFKDLPVRFNYSHCKYGAACIVADDEVGVDIESTDRFTQGKIIKKVCCDNELTAIEQGAQFIEIWVQKEAYAKFTGKGFAEGFKTIDTTTFPKELVFKQGDLYIACYFEPVSCSSTPQLVQVLPP
ncbi:MAG: 4'-phosphopantetheinyl transferase superfamily protein [Oscillospiraceae bacterium]|nr:4'-phosphopantetheinyl transferase superfamily protein [Oscillospiraceae bacterium]